MHKQIIQLRFLFFLMTGFLMSFTPIQAQPSDAQVKKDIMNPGVLSIRLSNTNGEKIWLDNQYYWQRGVVVVRNAKIPEYPNATVEIGGLARYWITAGKYSFNKFLVTWNEYKGIPVPTDSEVLEMVSANMEQFLGNYNYNKIVGEVSGLQMAAEKLPEWHSPNSFSINIACHYAKITSYTEVTDYDAIYRVRFYRDAVKSPWKARFLSSNKEEKPGAKKQYSAEEIRTMPTLGSIEQERKANEALAGLPAVSVPNFQRDVDVYLYIHKILREGDPEKFEAVMMQLMAPAYFVEGSTTRLNQRGADLINHNIRRAFEGKATYAECYCPDPKVKHHQTNMIEFWDKIQRTKTRIALGQFGGHYDRGVKVGMEYKITALEVYTLQSQDDIARMKSWPEDEICGSR